MKKKTLLILSLTFTLLLVACGSDPDDTNNPDRPVLTDISDTLLYSLDRLSQVDLNVNLDALVATEPENVSFVNKNVLLNGSFFNESSPGTVDIDTETDTLTYTDLVDSSNIGLEFRNLNQGISSFAESSKLEVDWALENISVENIWVTLGDRKLALSYDEDKDIVTLSSANLEFESSDDATYALRQIAVYYNDLGQLVVDVFDASQSGTFAYFGRLTYIKDTLYEWSSDIWANGIKEENPMAGGTGWFKAYVSETTGLWMYFRSTDANISYNVQTPNGWLQTFIRVSEFDEVVNDTAVFDYVKVATKGLENDVFSFQFEGSDQTYFRFYPTAFNGWTSITASYSEAEVRNLQDWSPDLYDDVDVYDSMNASIVYDNNYQETEETRASVMIMASNVDNVLGEYSVSYVAEASMIFNVSYLNLLPAMKERFNTYGLTYKHGSLDQLFNETIETILNLERLFDQFELNDTRGFVDLEVYRSVVRAEMAYLHALPERYEEAFAGYETIDYTELPVLSLDGVSFIDFSANTTGSVSFNSETETVSTTNLTLSLEPSLLLRENQNYTIIYGLYTNQAFVYIGEEAPVTFTGETLTITGNQALTGDTSLLQEARYVLVGYLARVTEDGHIRVSSVTALTVDAFTAASVSRTDDGIVTTVSYENNEGLIVDVSKEDNQAPFIIIDDPRFGDVAVTFVGTGASNVIEVTFPEVVSLQSILENIEFIDNSPEAVIFGIDALTFNGVNVTEFDTDIQAGTYVITVSDTSGNVTTLTINTIVTAG